MRKRWLIVLVLAITTVFFSASVYGFDLEKLGGSRDIEVEIIKSEFERRIGGNLFYSDEYLQLVRSDIVRMIENAPQDFLAESQFFVYVDRNSQKQLIALCFFNADNRQIEIIGADKISTGNPNRKGHFITPVGFFKNTIENFSYRALGTKNSKGWRGLGVKNSRVWDFGWQKTPYKKSEERDIRLLMHATDPDFGEARLGKVDSKGCIRVSGRMNNFLDYFGILDKEYEFQNKSKKVSWLLRNDRWPVNFSGKYLVVGDSSGYFK